MLCTMALLLLFLHIQAILSSKHKSACCGKAFAADTPTAKAVGCTKSRGEGKEDNIQISAVLCRSLRDVVHTLLVEWSKLYQRDGVLCLQAARGLRQRQRVGGGRAGIEGGFHHFFQLPGGGIRFLYGDMQVCSMRCCAPAGCSGRAPEAAHGWRPRRHGWRLLPLLPAAWRPHSALPDDDHAGRRWPHAC